MESSSTSTSKGAQLRLRDVVDVGSCEQRLCLYADAELLAGEDVGGLAFVQALDISGELDDTRRARMGASARPSSSPRRRRAF